MIRYGAHVMVAVLGILLSATVGGFALNAWPRPDVALLVVVYLGLRHRTGSALPAVIACGYFADLFSGLPDGAYLFLYLLLYSLTRIACRAVFFRGSAFPIAVSLLMSGLLVLGLSLFERLAATQDGVFNETYEIWNALRFVISNLAVIWVIQRIGQRIDITLGHDIDDDVTALKTSLSWGRPSLEGED